MRFPRAHTTPPRGAAAPFGPTLVVSVALLVGSFAALMAVTVLLVHPDPHKLASQLGVQQNQNAKTALYLIAFAVLLPLSLWVGARLSDRVAAGPNAAALGVLAATLTATFAVALLVVKASALLPWRDGLGVLLAATLLWAALAAAAVARASRPRPWHAALRWARHEDALAMAAGALVLAAILAFSHLSALKLAAVLAGGATLTVVLLRGALPRLPRVRPRWALAVDGLVLVLIVLAVPDLVVFTTSSAVPSVFFPPGIIQFHHDFLLGPTNQVLHGGTLLVDSPVSQYGVGSVYFLAGWFHLAPIGYGTYGLLDGILTAGYFAAGYCVLRVAGARRLLAIGAMAVAVVVFVYNLDYPIGALPQQGPLRFGLPMLLVLFTVVAVRSPRHARVARAGALAVVGLSAIWALEAFAYTALTFAALVAVHASLLPARQRRSWLAREVALGAGACAVAHLVLAAATSAATGELPHWGQYLGYLRAFLGGGDAGQITYGFERWSPGLAVGAGYAASVAGIVLLIRRRPAFAEHHAALLVALAGLTAYGIALHSYTQNRSSTYLLPYVSLPALLAGALWLTLILRSGHEGRPLPGAALAFAGALALAVLLSAHPVGARFSRSALAHVRPGGGLRAALTRLWHPPPIDPRATRGVAALDRFMPGRREVLILLPKTPELEVEILLRSRRANRLPVGNPIEESFVPSVWAPLLRRAIARLHRGDRILIDGGTLQTLAALRARPGFDPLARPAIGTDALEEWIGLEITRRYALRPVGRTAGFVVAELAAR